MGVSWLGALCLVQAGVIIWIIGFLCSSIRFHWQQQTEIQELRRIMVYWSNQAKDFEDINAKLRSTAEDQRHENESAKRALEFFDEMRRALEKFDDGAILF